MNIELYCMAIFNCQFTSLCHQNLNIYFRMTIYARIELKRDFSEPLFS